MNATIVPTAEEPGLAVVQPYREIGTLWRRFVAFTLDGLLLSIAIYLVAIPFYDQLSLLGSWGPVLGFFLVLPYFAILNSRIGNGQTLGKRWLHLQVVDRAGHPISFKRSLIRYAVFACPFSLGSLLPTPTPAWLVLSCVLSGALVTVAVMTAYLVVFNRHTRQGLHDLAAGSYVADSEVEGALGVRPIWKMHWVILGCLLIGSYASGIVLMTSTTTWARLQQLTEDIRVVEQMDGVQSVDVQDLTGKQLGKGPAKRVLVLQVDCWQKLDQEEVFAKNIARLVLEHDPTAHEHDLIRVIVTRGYDLGIADAHVSRTFEYPPDYWKSNAPGVSTSQPAAESSN